MEDLSGFPPHLPQRDITLAIWLEKDFENSFASVIIF